MGETDDEYTPVKPRKNRRKQEQQHLKDQKMKFVGSTKDLNNQINKESITVVNLSVSNNLSRFLEATAPSVHAQYFSKTTMKGWRCDVEYQHYFTLEDLWDSFKESSAYGAGVPLVLDGNVDDGLVQYYVPYLSAIQLYAESSNFDAKLRFADDSSEDSDGDDFKFSSCDGSSDYEIVEDVNSISSQEQFMKIDNFPSHSKNLSSPGKQHKTGEGNDTHAGISQGQLLFQFFEQESPYSREPLASKVGELAEWYPQLRTLRSCDLLPSSWMSVAWYPIYRIPSGSSLKDLDACFLTYHCLSTPLKGEGNTNSPKLIDSNEFDGTPRYLLRAFGMASYKFKGAIWTDNRDSACPLMNSLMPAANRWLKLLQVNHPDFEFFLSRSSFNG